jgi:hypothetical protein
VTLTDTDLAALRSAMKDHCSCAPLVTRVDLKTGRKEQTGGRCSACQMLDSPRVVGLLLGMRGDRERLIREEFGGMDRREV